MLIAVMSDSHNNMKNISKAMKIIKERNVDAIIHCGDVTRKATVKKLLLAEIPLFISLGNMDERDAISKEFTGKAGVWIYPDYGEIKIGDKLIAFTHLPHIAESLAKTGKYEIVFYGHTHMADETAIRNTRLVNPGDIEGRNKIASTMIYDTEKGTTERIQV